MYENFKKLMDEKGITAYKVSQDTGISQATLSDWKNGKITPRFDKLLKLSEYFDVDIEYLVGQSDVKRKSGMSKEELAYYSELGESLKDQEVKEALGTITQALNNQIKLNSREKRLIDCFRLLSDEMQNRLLDLTEASAKNTPQRP